MKDILAVFIGQLAALWLWNQLSGQRTSDADGTGGPGGAGGAGGSALGGAGGAGGAGGTFDGSALAAALDAIAAGVAVPGMYTALAVVSAGVTELVTAQPGKVIRVFGYSLSTAVAANVIFEGTSGADLWRVDLEAVAGKTGANLALPWPSFVFSTTGGEGLQINTTGAATVAVAYWLENA